MDYKNTKILTDVKMALKKSLEAWNPLLNEIEHGLIEKDWKIISNMGKLVDGSLKKIEHILQIDKKKDHTEPSLEKVGILVRGGNIEVYDLTDNVIVHIIEHDNKDVYIVDRDKEGKIRTRAAGSYALAGRVEEFATCDHCHEPVFNSVLCSMCHSAVCNNCIDWACMAKTDTQSIICKKCSQLFENCKEDK